MAGAQPQGPGPRSGSAGARARRVTPARARRNPRDEPAGRGVDALRRRRDPARILAATVSRTMEQSSQRRHRADPAQRDRRASARIAERAAPRQGHALPGAPLLGRTRMQLDEFQELMARTYGAR